MPAEYGSHKTALKRLKLWQELGVWDEILRALASSRRSRRAERVVVDSSTVEAKKRESWQVMNRRKGSKIYVCVDGESMPLIIAIGPGGEHDSKKLMELFSELYAKPRDF